MSNTELWERSLQTKLLKLKNEWGFYKYTVMWWVLDYICNETQSNLLIKIQLGLHTTGLQEPCRKFCLDLANLLQYQEEEPWRKLHPDKKVKSLTCDFFSPIQNLLPHGVYWFLKAECLDWLHQNHFGCLSKIFIPRSNLDLQNQAFWGQQYLNKCFQVVLTPSPVWTALASANW